jgi:hypothetical protein
MDMIKRAASKKNVVLGGEELQKHMKKISG